MARPQKQTVDYYPHVAKCGKTIFILERRWGNDGYAAFHKILETLCTTDGHIINYGNPVEREYLIAKTLVPEQTLTEIIELLVSLGKFDAELWKEHKIWYQKLVDSIADVYKKRVVELPQKPFSDDRNTHSQEFPVTETICDGVSGDGNPQSKLKKTKVKETKEKIAYDEFVFMTEQEYKKLIDKFGVNDTADKIDNLNTWYGKNPANRKKNPDAYYTILSWARKEEKPKQTELGKDFWRGAL